MTSTSEGNCPIIYHMLEQWLVSILHYTWSCISKCLGNLSKLFGYFTVLKSKYTYNTIQYNTVVYILQRPKYIVESYECVTQNTGNIKYKLVTEKSGILILV